MSQLAGRSVVVKASTNGTTFNTVAELNSCDMALAGNTIDVTTFGDDFIAKIQGLRDCSWTCDGNYDPTDATGQAAIRDALLNDTDVYVQFLFDGAAGFKQQVRPSKFEVKATPADPVTVSFTLDGTGAVTAV